MAVGLPLKTTYANGDVYSASDVNDTNGTINTTAAPYAAGKNKIINGDFRFNQRGFTSTTTTFDYGFDRMRLVCTDGTVTYSAQTFTPGTAPVAGYEAANFAQIVTSGQTLTTASASLVQRIEDVRTLAGQTATVSFWAKANTGTPNTNVVFSQNFGTGGSPSSAVVTTGTAQAITTSWARYSFTISVPSISGKTIGTDANSSFIQAGIFVSGGSASQAPTVGVQNNTFQIWGFQVEQGSTATPFATATGTIQGELAACQRYFQNVGSGITGQALSSSIGQFYVNLPVTMRVAPTATFPAAPYTNALNELTVALRTPTALASGTITIRSICIAASGASSMTVSRMLEYAGGTIQYSAEL